MRHEIADRRAAGRTRRVRVALSALLLGLAHGCGALEQDDFVSQGGNSPDPTARVEGTVLYIGPRPQCEYAGGSPTRVRGRVVLTLFEYENSPPPEGTATTSLNLLTLDGDDLFERSDCLPPESPQDPTATVTRSIPFAWPRFPLVSGRITEYQIRGFYDYDEDFVPFFSVTRLPTSEDIVGAALNDLSDASKGMLRVQVPALEGAEKGAVVTGITVALGSPVVSERPVFRLSEHRRLAADSFFAPTPGAVGLQNFRSLSCATPGTPDCGLTLQRLGEADRPTLAAAGIQLSLDNPAAYAFYAEPVDIRTVVLGGPDLPQADGVVDPHPFLSGLGHNWYTPLVLMQRIQSALEQQAKIPRVLMVGSVLLDEAGKPTKSSYTAAPIAIPPVAAVELIANDTTCRVPYFAPALSEADQFLQRLVLSERVAHCAELPTGRYSVNVFAGIAGGTRTAGADASVHESTLSVVGGRYSGQSWSIPNELALDTEVGSENVLPDQGVEGTFVVHDPSLDEPPQCQTGTLFGVCPADYELVESASGFDAAGCLPARCCAEIAHLYGIRRCEPLPDGSGLSAGPSALTGTAANGAAIPDCVPFELPAQCRPPL
jgi:hypothetical protein